MSVIMLCANAEDAKRHPGFETVLVSNLRALEGVRLTAAFATRSARDSPDFSNALLVVRSSVRKMVGEAGSFPQVVVVGGDLPEDVERVA